METLFEDFRTFLVGVGYVGMFQNFCVFLKKPPQGGRIFENSALSTLSGPVLIFAQFWKMQEDSGKFEGEFWGPNFRKKKRIWSIKGGAHGLKFSIFKSILSYDIPKFVCFFAATNTCLPPNVVIYDRPLTKTNKWMTETKI